MRTKLTREEMETVIVFNEESPTAVISTYNRSLTKRLEQMEDAVPSSVDSDGTVITWEVPKKLVKINKPRKGKSLTEEQRLASAERLRKAREAKNK